MQIYHFYFVLLYYFVKFARMRKYQNTMKKSYILVLAVVLMTVTGCDFFRKLAGRPTSEEIEIKRQEMVADLKAKAEREKEVQDSLVLAAKRVADSLSASSYMEENNVRVHSDSSLGGIEEESSSVMEVEAAYRVIVGSCKDKGNADKMAAKVAAAGDFNPHQVKMRSGMIAVAACPSDRIQDVLKGMDQMKKCGVCPEDAWILKID